jgi:hypothetical protein
VEPLLGLLAVLDQPTTVTNRRAQGVDRELFSVPTARALTGQIRQRSASPVVGLEPTRPQLSAGDPGFGGCEESQRPRVASLQLRCPRPMQALGRLDRDQRPGMRREQ